MGDIKELLNDEILRYLWNLGLIGKVAAITLSFMTLLVLIYIIVFMNILFDIFCGSIRNSFQKLKIWLWLRFRSK